MVKGMTMVLIAQVKRKYWATILIQTPFDTHCLPRNFQNGVSYVVVGLSFDIETAFLHSKVKKIVLDGAVSVSHMWTLHLVQLSTRYLSSNCPRTSERVHKTSVEITAKPF